MIDFCIIGGGASAMAAAVAYRKTAEKNSVCILEKKEKPGKKLAATGNGKCNLSNVNCDNLQEILSFFHGLGILTRTDAEGRIYPYSEQARDVVTAFIRNMESQSVQVVTDCSVRNVRKISEGFEVTGDLNRDNGKMYWKARKVLIATGGKSAPQFGTTGDGYRLAMDLGHQVNKLSPVLTAIECSGLSGAEKGVRVKGTVFLEKDGQILEGETGEIQMTEDGLSGICIFNLSRLIQSEKGEPFFEALKRYHIIVDFFPDMEASSLETLLKERLNHGFLSPESMLLSLVPEKLMETIWKAAFGKEEKAESESLKDQCPARQQECLRKLTYTLKGWRLAVTGVKGWKQAQCTAGGVDLNEVNLQTMESKKIPGLYFSGEVLDYAGPCGGYNLHHAWETGIKAGSAAASDELSGI